MLRFLLPFLFFSVALLQASIPTEESITKLYIATFNRAPEAGGLNYWLESGLQLEEISASFFDQKETKENYPPEFTEEDFIIEVYDNVLQRTPEEKGLNYWLKELES